jgi:integrase
LIGDKPVDLIDTKDILAIAGQPHTRPGGTEEKRFWESVPERARRCLKKVEDILGAETRLGHRAGDNPAAWRDHLSKLLSKPDKLKAHGRQPALPYAQLPEFMAALRARDASTSARALEFLILTAARSGEVRGATWAEMDFEKGVWTVPAVRMKAGKEHRVPLPKAALTLLKAAPRFAKSDLIWPGAQGKPMSDATLTALMKKLQAAEERAGRAGWLDPESKRPATPHGFRSTFRDWAAETGVDRDVAEIALAHNVGSVVERAYRRTDMLEQRRAVMEDWAGFALADVGTGLRAVG